MQTKTIWREDRPVKSSETDFQKRLKLSSYFLWMQDVAAEHAASLGFGYHDILQQELAWVLSRIKVRFYDFPPMGEQVSIQTWPKGIQQKLFFMRDYQLTGADGRQVALATSAYVLINTRIRRMVLPDALTFPVPDNDGRYALDESLNKIAAVEALSPCYTLQAGYSAVDIMEHVNNARYIDWITDCFSIEEHQSHRPGWLQINYLNEVKAGETVSLMRGQRPTDPKAWYITAVNQSSGAKAFEAELRWL